MNRVSDETRKQRRPPSSKRRGKQQAAEEKRAAQLNIAETKSNTHTTPHYIKDSMKRVRRVKAEQEEKSREELKRRTDAILALKESIAHSQDVLRVRRRRECVRSERREKREQQELQTLKAAGVNTTGHTHMQTHLQKLQQRQQ
ncbi:cilia- and flagella-associated protein 74-like [Engraulis encrasicolus]|uniref:cilia- and flagella-associated protein 74-like n=1 Tax=Engraulis encrasicolus TaxID=184585 RepID=UPI002FD57FC1